MSVKIIAQEQSPQLQEVRFGRPLTNDEMISLQQMLWSDELKDFLVEGEHYPKPGVSRIAARWYSRNAAANQKVIAATEAFAADLPEAADEPHPELLSYEGGQLSLQEATIR